MPNYLKGENYNRSLIDVSQELVPHTSQFKTYENETHAIDKPNGYVSFNSITQAIEDETITSLDKTILSLVATFSYSACTTRSLHELITLLGFETSRNMIESSINRLSRFALINLSRFTDKDGKAVKLIVITLSKFGSQYARTLDVPHTFNPFNTVSAQAYSMKSRIQTTQLICNWLKNVELEYFNVRPLKNHDAKKNAIIRPSASMKILDEILYFEVPRRHEDWLEDISDKLNRYKLVFKYNTDFTLIINGEDEEMNRKIDDIAKKIDLDFDILFTDDLAMFGPAFKTCLYNFDEFGEILRYKIKTIENT